VNMATIVGWTVCALVSMIMVAVCVASPPNLFGAEVRANETGIVQVRANETGIPRAETARADFSMTQRREGKVTSLAELPECKFFWHFDVGDVVANGWGSKMLFFATMYERFTMWAPDCEFLMSEDIASTWSFWGFNPPGIPVPQQEWVDMDEANFTSVDAHFRTFLHGPWQGERLGEGFWSDTQTAKNEHWADLAGRSLLYGDDPRLPVPTHQDAGPCLTVSFGSCSAA